MQDSPALARIRTRTRTASGGDVERKGSLLSHAPNVTVRATITADRHGGIVSANSAVLDFFGYLPEELIDNSCRKMLQLLPQKRQLLAERARDPERFSKTAMWQDVMGDLTSVRVVNGKHKDGSLVPMLLTSSAMNMGGVELYALLFERIPEHSAIITTDHDGIVQSATSNIFTILRVPARELCGKGIQAVLKTKVDANFLLKSVEGQVGKHVTGKVTELKAETPEGPVLVELQVIDSQHNMFVVTIRISGHQQPHLKPLLNSKGDTEDEIGYYTVKEELGVGQCGAVKKAIHRTTGSQVALKTLSKAKFVEIGLKWNDKELELMRYLNHPNIVHLYDYVSGDDVSYLVVELVEGGELLTYCCNKGPLDEDESRKFFRDILGAVDYLHRKGIVHRDLKLENCLLDTEKNVKIIDFGLANFYLNGTLKTSCGSADYAAPELFAADKYFGPPVDVWAMGVILFAMLAGVFPFEEVQATIDGEYWWPTEVEVPQATRELVKDIFVLNPDLRLTVDQIRRNDWVNAGYGAPPPRPAISVKPFENSVKRDVWTFRLDILVQMEHSFGFAIEAVVESLLNEDINQMTATYKMLMVKYPQEMKANVADPNTAIYTNTERQEAAKALIQQAHKRRERGAALDLVPLRTNLRDRTQSESIDRPSSIDEIIKRRQAMARSGSVAAPAGGPHPAIPTLPIQSVQKNPLDSPFALSASQTARPYEETTRTSSGSNPGSRSSRGASGSMRQKLFEKRASGKKNTSPPPEKADSSSSSKSYSYSMDEDEAAPSTLLKSKTTGPSTPQMRPLTSQGTKKKKNSIPPGGIFNTGNDTMLDPDEDSTPVITGGILGSFWKHKKDSKEKRPSRKGSIKIGRDGKRNSADNITPASVKNSEKRKSVSNL